jgi:hypothetical protein
LNFRTYDRRLAFMPEEFARVDALVGRLRAMKASGELLYDSDEYLDDIKRFVRNEPTQWRGKNRGVCDSPALYFAILPNGDFAVCCDYRLPGTRVSTYARAFPEIYRGRSLRQRATAVAGACEGCMFGSYPEITLTARYWSAALERMKVFLGASPMREWPISSVRLQEVARSVRLRRVQPEIAAR